MGIINNCYRKMISETERALKSKKISAKERANLESLRKKLRKEYNAQLEIATGKSAKFIKQTNKNIADSFCKRSDKFLKQARKDAAAYRKSKNAQTKRSKVKSGRKNLKTSSRIIRDSLEAFIKRVSRNEKSLKPALKADGTSKIYTAAKQKKIAKATERLRNRTSDLFNANRKIDKLRNMK